MDFEKFKAFEPLYIVGHKKPDVDSVISTILLASIFKSNGIDAYPCFLKDDYEINEYNLKILNDCCSLDGIVKIDNLDSYNYVLVDHNDPIQSVGFGKKIVWGIDHHSNSKILSNIVLGDECSCGLRIYTFFKDIYNFTNEEKFLIYMSALTDSLFFRGSRFTNDDKEIVSKLGFDLDVDSLFKKYFIPTDISVGFDDIFLSDSKEYVYNGITFTSVVVRTFNKYDYLKKEFKEKIVNTPNCLGTWIDLDKEISYAYFNYNGEVKEFIYDFIASRAATVIPDVYRYIDNLKND